MEGSDQATDRKPRDRSRRPRRGPDAGEPSGRTSILDAAIASILELGFYRASSNEIARRAGVSWGSIQYHFGSRESLMLAVLKELDRRYNDSIRRSHVEGDTLAERLRSLYGHLAEVYDNPVYLARIQIVLNLRHDPDTSAEIVDELTEQFETIGDEFRRLLREALGDQADSATVNAVFHAIRGTALSRQLGDAIPYLPGSGQRPKAEDERELSIFLAGLAAAAGDVPVRRPDR